MEGVILRILKFPLEAKDVNVVEMPVRSKVLSVQHQGGDDLMLWALCPNGVKTEKRQFHIYGTGHNIPEHKVLYYVGTALMYGGSLVWHVFERI